MIFRNKSRNSPSDSASSSSIAIHKKKISHEEPVHDKLLTEKSTVQPENACMIKLKLQSMGPICESRRQINSSSRKPHQEDEEANDFVDQFAKQGWPNDDSGMWLSAGSSSPSTCFDDKIFGNLLEFSLDDWLASDFILRENSNPGFSGSRINPLEEASFVLQRPSSFQEDTLNEDSFLAEEINSWLMNFIKAEDGFGQSYRAHSSSSFESPEIWDFEEGILSSLVDLEDGEYSDWISDSELNFLQIDFPSPSYKKSWSSDMPQSSNSVPSIDCFGEAELTEPVKARSDEPIFWPFVQKFGRSSELSRDFLIMSPRRDISKLLLQNTKMELRERHNSNLRISSRLASPKILENKQGRRDDNVKQIKATSSQSTELIKSSIKDDIAEEILDLDKNFIFLWEDFPGVEELPIENLLGLHEFDGHEGIEVEFNQDSFLMDESF